MGDTETPDGSTSDQSLKTILDNPQLFGLFMRAIDERAAAKLQERMTNTRNWLIGSISIGTVIIAAVGGTLINYIAEDAAETAVEKVVGSAVEKAVGPAVEKAVATAQFDGQVAGLNFRVLSIDLAEGISNDDAMAIIEEIETLYSQPPNEDSRNKLVFAVETAVKNFFLIDRPDLVGRLREKVPDVFQNSDAILTTEILFQGRKLLADASAPRSWLDDLGDMRESYEDYRRYAAQAKSAYPGLYLAYELPLRHVEGRSTEEILGLIEDADNLSAENAENFDSIIIGLADASEDSDVESRRVADRVGKFLCEFQEYSMLLRYVSGNCPSCLDCPGEPMR